MMEIRKLQEITSKARVRSENITDLDHESSWSWSVIGFRQQFGGVDSAYRHFAWSHHKAMV